MNIRCRSAIVVGSLLPSCSLMFGAWIQLNSGTMAVLNAVDFPTGTQVGYAAGFGPDSTGMIAGQVFKTTDGGDTWVMLNVTGTQMVQLNAVSFTDDNNGFAVGTFGTILHTTDGGATWTKTTDGTAPLTNVRFPSKGQIGYIGVSPLTLASIVLRTTDGGETWTSHSVGGPLDWSTSCAFATDSQGVVVGKGGMVYGINGDSSAPQGPNTNADIAAAAFSPTAPNKGYLIGNDSNGGVVRYTTTFGPQWDSVRCPPVTRLRAVTMATNDIAYFGGDSGGHAFIGVSADPEDIYKTIVNVSSTINGLCFPVGADTGYAVGSGGVILWTYDGGGIQSSVAEGKGSAIGPAGIRVVSNPSRHGVSFRADVDVNVVVSDAVGRVVKAQAASKGLNFLPLSRAGVYFVRADAKTIRVVLTE